MTEKSIAAQLLEAYSGAEDSKEGNYKNLIKVDSSVLDDPLVVAPEKQPESNNIGINNTSIDVLEQQNVDTLVDKQNESLVKTEQKTVSIKQDEKKEEVSIIQNIGIDEKVIKQIIEILDLYRSYETKIQTTVKRFIGIKKDDNDLHSVIFSIITMQETDKIGLIDLVSLKEEERTSRAFSLVSLDNSRLEKVKDLVVLFNNNFTSINSISDKILYCKELEIGIETLEQESLKYLKPMNDLFIIKKDE